MADSIKKETEKESLLNETEDMYIGEESGGATKMISSLVVCGPVITITIASKGIVCNPFPPTTIR